MDYLLNSWFSEWTEFENDRVDGGRFAILSLKYRNKMNIIQFYISYLLCVPLTSKTSCTAFIYNLLHLCVFFQMSCFTAIIGFKWIVGVDPNKVIKCCYDGKRQGRVCNTSLCRSTDELTYPTACLFTKALNQVHYQTLVCSVPCRLQFILYSFQVVMIICILFKYVCIRVTAGWKTYKPS